MRVKRHKTDWLTKMLLLLLLASCLPVAARFRYTTMAMPNKEPQKVSYSILIDTGDKRLYLLRNGRPFKSYRCAVGTVKTPSPLGGFHIVSKSHWGEGFGGYWLGLDCPWGQYGIHGTLKPESIGLASSHGCFRMYTPDVAELYGYVAVGTPVVVTGGCLGPFGSHYRTISPGMYGADVLAVQRKLSSLGFYKGELNGRYDAAGFRTALHRFQKAYGLKVSDSLTRSAAERMGFVFMD